MRVKELKPLIAICPSTGAVLQETIYFVLFLDKVKTLSSSQHLYLVSFAQLAWDDRSQSEVKESKEKRAMGFEPTTLTLAT